MITGRWWRALRFPPYNHPLFERVRDGTSSVRRVNRVLRYTTLGVLLSFPPCAVIVAAISNTYDLNRVLLLLSTPLILIYGSGTLVGAVWALDIASEISQRRQRRVYRLLCVLPDGEAAALWMISLAVLERFGGLRWLRNLRLLCLAVSLAFVVPMVILLEINVSNQGSGVPDISFYWTLYGLVVLVGFVLDYAQSTTLGAATSIALVALTLSSTVDRLLTLSVYLFLQGACYLLAAFVGLSLGALLFSEPRTATLAGMLVGVVTLLLVREGVLALLWGRVVRRLHTNLQSLSALAWEQPQ